ncbi:hypothetical protein TheveDRAFT_1407 [Thermanaerovibrio velox DSM 12556]|uniref:Uncharacterized protein n=1 Tax=Thermanaerovibrio velox DSM 12556 TaxID=926567 RepID=H0UP22_9BACT|nr:hypothetical protein [Thermanaerovibrio velox]EHM10525.1 hypothetical protein TheveDRAFT_1407 [Thermanaerovibrio velox DSM 12556]
MRVFSLFKRRSAALAVWSGALFLVLWAFHGSALGEPDPRNSRYLLPGDLWVSLSDGEGVAGDLVVQLVDARPLDPLGLTWAALLKTVCRGETEWFIASAGESPFKTVPLEDRSWVRLSVSANLPSFLPKVVRVIDEQGRDLRFRPQDDRLVPLSDDWEMPIVKKPVIYLYPPVRTFVVLEPKPLGKVVEADPPLGPWRVYASPDGSLSTGGHSLYYECSLDGDVRVELGGWVVRADDLDRGLRAVGNALGLEGPEVEEFANYWRPILKRYGVDVAVKPFDPSFVRVHMPLEVDPLPDTEIRALVAFSPWDGKPLETPDIKVPVRRGFTLVEWGGLWIDKP